MLDHANVAAMCDMTQAALGITAADHSLLVLPLFHVNGIIVGTLSPLLAGGRVDDRRPVQPQDVLRHRRAGPPDVLLGGARDLRDADLAPAGATADTSSLRLVVCGAAPMPRRADRARSRTRFGVALSRATGSRRARARRRSTRYDGVRKPGTVGLPLPGQEVRVVDHGRPARPAGRARRGRHPRRQRHARLPQQARGDRQDARRRLAAHRRRRRLRRRRLPADRRPHQGHDHPRRREHLSQGDRGGAATRTTACSRPRSSARPDDVLGEVVVAYVALRPDADGHGRRAARALRRAAGEVQAPRGHRAASTRCRRTPIGKIDKPALRALAA